MLRARAYNAFICTLLIGCNPPGTAHIEILAGRDSGIRNVAVNDKPVWIVSGVGGVRIERGPFVVTFETPEHQVQAEVVFDPNETGDNYIVLKRNAPYAEGSNGVLVKSIGSREKLD